MRILLDYRPALRQRTGVGAYIHETARALAETREPGESLVLFSSSWKDRLVPGAVPVTETVDRRVPVRLLNLAWHRLGFPPVEMLAGSGYDVVQTGHPLLMPSRRAARLVTIHDLDFLDHPERTRAEVRRDYRALAARHARLADQVIAVSAHTALAVESRLGVPAERITICPPGGPDWQRRPSLPSRGACILFLGTLEPRKNLHVLLDAYARMVTIDPGVPRLVLAGNIAPEAEPLIARTRLPPLGGRVDLPGYVDDATKAALFARAAVFVLPSHTEGFGITVVEAMKAGVPVVAANRGALPETVGRAGRLVEPDDVEGLAQTLLEVVQSPAVQAQMADAGQAQAARFSWTHTAQRTREAWHLALAHRAARRG